MIVFGLFSLRPFLFLAKSCLRLALDAGLLAGIANNEQFHSLTCSFSLENLRM